MDRPFPVEKVSQSTVDKLDLTTGQLAEITIF